MGSLSEFSIAVTALFALLLLRVPVGIAMIIVGFTGFLVEAGTGPALAVLQQAIFHAGTDEVFAVIPLFVLMGSLAFVSGISDELFDASNAWLGHLRGGLALSSMTACGGFAAICGSSVASAATMGKVALPAMKERGYPADFSAAIIAAGGTLGVLIPPSVVLALYGVLVETDISALFAAALIPGLLALIMYLGVIYFMGARDPQLAPSSEKVPRREAIRKLGNIWATVTLFVLVIGGIYVGWFTPSEAAAVGAIGLIFIGVLRGRLNAPLIFEALSDTALTTGKIFLVVIGAVMFSRYLAVNQVTADLTDFITGLDMLPFVILLFILLFYLVMGAFLDALAVIVLTVPVIHPIIVELGFNEIWFGIILVIVVELGLITPPYGMNVFVLRGVSKELPLIGVFKRLLPFIGIDMVRLLLLVAFPVLVLAIPEMLA